MMLTMATLLTMRLRVLLSCRGVVVVERVSWVCCYGCEVAIVGVGELQLLL